MLSRSTLTLAVAFAVFCGTLGLAAAAETTSPKEPIADANAPKDLGTLLDISNTLPNTCPTSWIEKHPGAYDNHPNELGKIDLQPLLKELGFPRIAGSAHGKTAPRWQTATLTETKKDLSLLPAWLDGTKSLPEAEVTRKGSSDSTFFVAKWGTANFTSLAGAEKATAETAVATPLTLTLVPTADAKAGVKKVLLLACLVGNQIWTSKSTLEVKSITIGTKEYPITPKCLLSSDFRCTMVGRGFQVPVKPGVPIIFNLVITPDKNNGSLGTWLAFEE